MRRSNYTMVLNNKVVTLNDLVKNGYRYVLKDGRSYINIQDGYCIRRPFKNRNLKYVRDFTPLCEIKDLIKAVYDLNGKLIYKVNKHSGQLNGLIFLPKKGYKQKLKERNF